MYQSDFKELSFFGSWLLVGLEGADLTTQVSCCVGLKCQKEKQLKITTNCWKDLAWRLQFPPLALPHALFSLTSTFKRSVLRQRLSAVRNSVCPQTTYSFLWRPLFARDYWDLTSLLAQWIHAGKRFMFSNIGMLEKYLIHESVDQNTPCSSVFTLFVVELYGLVFKRCFKTLSA